VALKAVSRLKDVVENSRRWDGSVVYFSFTHEVKAVKINAAETNTNFSDIFFIFGCKVRKKISKFAV